MISTSRSGTVFRITFDRPEEDNRITYRMMLDYIDALQAAHDSGAHLLVIDAAGTHFTLGRDQKEKLPAEITRRDNLRLILRANELLRSFPGVSVSLINGRAMGFGSGIALHSTIAIGADDATLGFDEIRHGLAPLVVVAYLPYFISRKVAAELVASGRDVPAAEARDIGLLNRVVPAAELRAAGEVLIAQLQEYHPSALRLIRGFERDLGGYPEQAVREEAVARLAAWIDAGKP